MKKIMFSMVLVATLIFPMASYAETKEKCESKCLKLCSNKDDKGHADCMTVCMNQCIRDKHTGSYNLSMEPKSDLDSSTSCAEADTENEIATPNIIVATVMEDNDQPCYVGGKVAGFCSKNKPYFNVFNATCYPTLKDCKKADGDLETVQGSGGCVRCGK